jgi:hypothetical protein
MSEICASCGDEFNSVDGTDELCPNCQGTEEESPSDEFSVDEEEV